MAEIQVKKWLRVHCICSDEVKPCKCHLLFSFPLSCLCVRYKYDVICTVEHDSICGWLSMCTTQCVESLCNLHVTIWADVTQSQNVTLISLPHNVNPCDKHLIFLLFFLFLSTKFDLVCKIPTVYTRKSQRKSTCGSHCPDTKGQLCVYCACIFSFPFCPNRC